MLPALMWRRAAARFGDAGDAFFTTRVCYAVILGAAVQVDPRFTPLGFNS